MGDATLVINETDQNGVRVLTLVGDVDAHTSAQLKDAIDRSVAAGAVRIVYDFAKLNYISSAGIGVLNAALNAVKAKGGNMFIASPTKTVFDTLEVMYFTKKVTVYPTVSDAVKNI